MSTARALSTGPAGVWWRLPVLPLCGIAGEALSIAVLIPMFLFVAAWNGFPFLFFDSGAYVLEGFAHFFVPERSPVYSLFILYTDGRASMWNVALAQAAMTAVVVVEFARALWPRTSLWLMLRTGAALAILTSISWFVGQIEPDCMTAILVLAIYPLAFRLRQLGALRAIIMVVLAAIAIGAHPSHLGTSAGLVLCLAAARIAAMVWPKLRLPRPHLVLPGFCVVLGLGLVLAANYSLTKHVFVSRSGSMFLAARLMGDGVVAKTLDDLCPTHRLALCPYKDKLPVTADNFLWGAESPFNKIGRFYGNRADYELIVSHSLTHYPIQSLAWGLWGSLRQYFMVRSGDGVEPQEWVLGPLFRGFMPAQYADYRNAHQQRGFLHFAAVNVVHVPLALLAQIWLVTVLWRAIRRRRWNLGTLPAFVLVALIGNALVCGLFSGPHDRYQSRLAWVPCLIVLLTGRQTVERALRRPIESGT